MVVNSDICTMNIMIMAATRQEIIHTIDFIDSNSGSVRIHKMAYFISGVGTLASSYSLTQAILKQKPDFIIQAGIAGSFTAKLPPGTTVFVSEEIFGDAGAMEEGVFKDIFDLGLTNANDYPFTERKIMNPTCHQWKNGKLPFVTGITVNEITTDSNRIEQLKNKYDPAIESMEGIALHYVCMLQNIPFIQLRTISNYVGERDKRHWKLAEAILELNTALITFLQQIP